MLPTLLILPLLCVPSGVAVQNPAPKPAGLLPEARKWIEEHASDWDHGSFLFERMRSSRAIVCVSPEPAGVSNMLLVRCLESVLEREKPLCLCVPAGWEDGSALDAFVREGKGDLAALSKQAGIAGLLPPEHGVLASVRAWNADEKHVQKLRVAGSDYRATREEALGLTEFVAKIDPQVEQRTGQLLGPFRQLGPDGRNRYGQTDSNTRFAVRQLLADFVGSVEERREEWKTLVGPALLTSGLRSLARIQQAEQEVSLAAEFRRGRALCANARCARDERAAGADLLAFVELASGLEAQEAHAALGSDSLVVLILTQADAMDDVDLAALIGVRAGGALDLRELPKEGIVAEWFAAHLGKRADLVLWLGNR